MPNYRRPNVSGGTYFITQVTYQRDSWLCSDIGSAMNIPEPATAYPFTRVSARLRFENTTY